MTVLSDYQHRYEDITFERVDGVLTMTFGTDGGPLIWSERSHRELPLAFADVGGDIENHVVVMAGSGDVFLEEMAFAKRADTPDDWDKIVREGAAMITNLLEIGAPIVAAVNGPARHHAEIAVLSDIVLCSEAAVFQDEPHFPQGVVPGDGVHVLWPLLLGLNRGRHFLLTGRELSASEALDLGVVAEVLPRDELLPRAQAVAHELARRTPLALRYTRQCLTMWIKQLMADMLRPGLVLEGMAIVEMRRPGGAVGIGTPGFVASGGGS